MSNENDQNREEEKPSPWKMVLRVLSGFVLGILCWAAAIFAAMAAGAVSQGNGIVMTVANILVAIVSCWAAFRYHKKGYTAEVMGIIVVYLVPYIGISLSMGSCIGWR